MGVADLSVDIKWVVNGLACLYPVLDAVSACGFELGRSGECNAAVLLIL